MPTEFCREYVQEETTGVVASLFVHEGAKKGKMCDCCPEGDFPSVYPV